MPSKKLLWFRILLIDVNGQCLAHWNYDEAFPVIPPHFTYPNDNGNCPYVIRFEHVTVETYPLATNIDLNTAIADAVVRYVIRIKKASNG